MEKEIEDGDVGALLSPERLAPFMEIAGTERDAVHLHHQALSLSAALMPVIALLEIALRNAVCEVLRAKLGVANWLTEPPADHLSWHGKESSSVKKAIAHAQRAEYAKLSNTQKKALDAQAYPAGVPAGVGHARRAKARQKRITVGIGQIVAQLTLSFWKRLFSPDYETKLWKPALRGLFPNKTVSRALVAQHLEVIYEARNRIAHHEPVIGHRLDRLMESIDWVVTNFGASRPSKDAVLSRMTEPFLAVARREIEATEALIRSFTVGSSWERGP